MGGRLVVEGLVIVVSILLAFAIHARWDKLEALVAARDDASEFIGWMGSEPTIVPPEDFERTFRTMH